MVALSARTGGSRHTGLAAPPHENNQCKDMGLSVTAAYTMFATKVTREQRIPFEVTADPFFSEENMDRLRRNMAQMEKTGGTAHEVNLDD